jgi:hypothetical protein
VPSGIWAEIEYEKLPRYDAELFEQACGPAQLAFDCHQRDGNLCAGWIATHGAENLFSLRLQDLSGNLDPAVYDFVSPVPVWGSGQEACDHGMLDIDDPSPAAKTMIASLERKQARRG